MNKKVKKAGILLGIYLLICILDLILSQGFVNKVKDNVSFFVENLWISLCTSNINLISYAKSDVFDKNIYTEIGQNTGFFDYARNNGFTLNYTVYDPNLPYKEETKDLAELIEEEENYTIEQCKWRNQLFT